MTGKQVFSVFLFFDLFVRGHIRGHRDLRGHIRGHIFSVFWHLRGHIRIPIVVKDGNVSAGCTEKKRGKPARRLLAESMGSNGVQWGPMGSNGVQKASKTAEKLKNILFHKNMFFDNFKLNMGGLGVSGGMAWTIRTDSLEVWRDLVLHGMGEVDFHVSPT